MYRISDITACLNGLVRPNKVAIGKSANTFSLAKQCPTFHYKTKLFHYFSMIVFLKI